MLDKKNPDQRVNPEAEREMQQVLRELAQQSLQNSPQSQLLRGTPKVSPSAQRKEA